MLHHIETPERAVQRVIAALKPGGVFLSIEPDILPTTVAAPKSIHAFWRGWLAWSASVGIDYFIGRRMPSLLASLDLEAVDAEGNTACYNDGSPWATYWLDTIEELVPRLLDSGHLNEQLISDFNHHYTDSHFWTSAITFITAWGRKASFAEATPPA